MEPRVNSVEDRTTNRSGSDENSVMNSFYMDPPVAERVEELAYPGEILPKTSLRCSCCNSQISSNMFRGKVARAKFAVIAVSGGASASIAEP